MIFLNYPKIAISCCLLAFFIHQTAVAQDGTPDTEKRRTGLHIRSGVYVSGQDSLPFWFYSNINGKVEPSGTNFLNEITFSRSLLDTEKFTIGTGANLVMRWSQNSSIHFSELYLKANAWGLQLDAGRFLQPVGLNNHRLSAGSMMVSNNATPMPKISISTPDFTDVPFTAGYVQYKGMFSHGWFEEDRYVRSPYLHQKYLYLRVNISSFSGIGGIVHNAQWGGTEPGRGRLPQSFGDYLRLVSGLGAGGGSNAPGGERTNVIGNSVAAYEFGLEYRHETFTASLTRLFYLEDKVSTRFRSPWDGVWGANITFIEDKNWLDALTYEHVNTKNQDSKSWELIGRRDYYDNFLYKSGWTYEERTLGIPLILFDGTTITNNVLIGHHLGVEGWITSQLRYRSFFTYSRNYGLRNDWVSKIDDSIPKDRDDVIPREQFREDQYSLFLSLDYTPASFQNVVFNLKVSTDLGELYESSTGLMTGITWSAFK